MAYLSGHPQSFGTTFTVSGGPVTTPAPAGGPRFTVGGRRVAPPGRHRSRSGAAAPRSFAPAMPDPLAGYTDELGFSLKPPKFIRKAASAVKKAVTIKNVAKVAAIAGAVALAPVAGPAILAAGKFVVGKAGALLSPLIHRNAPATASAPPIDMGPLPPLTDQGQTAPMLGPGAIPMPPTGGPVPVPGTTFPDQSSTIGPPVPPGLTATVPPSPGDTYGPPVPEAHSNAALIGGVALLAVFAMASRRRRKGR